MLFFFFFKQKTAYEMRISDWSSDVCSSDLHGDGGGNRAVRLPAGLSGDPASVGGDRQRGEGAVLTGETRFRAFAELGSTNDWLADAARQGAPEGQWVRADRQTGGRGRRGRTWVSEPGNLYASTLIRLRGEIGRAHV